MIVFSTHVEVFLAPRSIRSTPGSFLHTRGGVSPADAGAHPWSRFSPHTWRCFSEHARLARAVRVFSTHVEVFP